MAAEAIKIRAQAAKLYKETGDKGVEGYKTMPLEDLKGHIQRIQSGFTGTAKGKPASTNGAAVAKGKVSKPVTTKGKGKSSASTSAPAKSSTQKSSPAKGKVATGTAKRPAAVAVKDKVTPAKGKMAPAKGKVSTASAQGGWQPGSRGRVPNAATKAQIAEHKRIAFARAAERKAPAKGKVVSLKSAQKSASKPVKTRGKAAVVNGRSVIDNKAVDWTAEWKGGKNGKRADVMKALRKFEGDKAKVFTLLALNARTYYKGRTKHEAERMLVWLIGRVAFDYVTATGQHEKGQRAAYGTASDPKNVARRAQREDARKEQEKAARSAKRAAAKGKAPAAKTTPVKGKKAAPAKSVPAKGKTTQRKGR